MSTIHAPLDLNYPGGMPLVVAIVIGALVGLAFVPIAAVGLLVALVVATVRNAWRATLRWVGLTPGRRSPPEPDHSGLLTSTRLPSGSRK